MKKIISRIPLFMQNISNEQIGESPLLYHLSKYPQLQAIDIYKFIFQGTCGWTHLHTLSKEEDLKNYLLKELKEVSTPLIIDELFELLDTKTDLGRLNLRVWKYFKGENIQPIWELMKKTEEKVPKDTKLFQQRWNEFTKYIKEGKIAVPEGGEEIFSRWLKLVDLMAKEITESSEMPLVSHSPMFKKTYRPNYRIVNRADLKLILEKTSD